MNKQIKGCLLLILISVLTLSVVSATDNINDSDITNTLSVENDDAKIITDTPDKIKDYDENHNTINKKTNEKKTSNESSLSNTTDAHKTIIFNASTFNQYVSNRQLNDNVSEGDTLDFQGLIYGEQFALTINKPVNIISSTNDAFYGNDKEMGFTINSGGSGTNLTNVHFYNVHFVTKNASYVNINNITVEVYNCLVGAGQGVTSIRDFSNNINITNSLFYSNSSIGVSTFVCAGAQNIFIENNTMRAEGYCGNVFYLTTYNLDEYASNENITIKNNLIDHSRAMSQNICIPLVLQGSNHKIINNTLLFNSTAHNTYPAEFSVMAQMVSNDDGEMIYDDEDLSGNLFINNTIEGPASISNALVVGNKFEILYIRNSESYNNTIEKAMIRENNVFVDNEANILNVTRENNTVSNNDYVDLIVNETTNPIIENNTKWLLINSTNIDEFAEIKNYNCTLNNLKTSDYTNILFECDESDVKTLIVNSMDNKTFKIRSNLNGIIINNSKISISQSDLSKTLVSLNKSDAVFKDSILLEYYSINSQIDLVNTSVISCDDTFILSKKNEYFKPNEYEDYFNADTNILLNKINNNVNLILTDYMGVPFSQTFIINKAINITSLDDTYLNGEIYFIKGSEGSNITNMKINGTIHIETSNINVINNTIYKNIVINNSKNNIIKYNTIDSTLIPITLHNTTNNIIMDNNITTTETYTIQIDNKSKDNQIKNNILISSDNYSRATVNADLKYNTVENNYPKQSVEIEFEINDSNVINIATSINISVTSNGEYVENGKIIIYSNSVKKAEVQVNGSRIETYIVLDKIGTNNIRVYYISEDTYSNNISTKKISGYKIKSYTNLTISPAKLYQNVTCTATLTDEYGDKINKGTVTFTINNNTYTTKVKNGTATFNTMFTEDDNSKRLSAEYSGTESIDNSSCNTILNMKGDSKIILTSTKNTNTTTITAVVTNMIGEVIGTGYVSFVGTDVSKLVKITNDKAELTINTPTDEMIINATFRNNPSYETSTAFITIGSKSNVILTCDNIGDVAYADEVLITGQLIGEDNTLISDADLLIVINNEEFAVKTGSDGAYSYVVSASNVGINNVSVIYNGDDCYNPANTSTTFTVNAKDTLLSINPISNVTLGENVSIIGTLANNDGKALVNVNIQIQVNDEKTTVKTDKNGMYTLTIVTNKTGTNNVSVSYAGNTRYNPSSATGNFTVTQNNTKQDTTITINNINSVKLGDNITISGTLKNTAGKVLTNVNIKITVNGVKSTVKTDKTGTYTLTTTTDTAGSNTITVTYAGNSKYNQASTTTTFTVTQDTNKLNPTITINNIESVTLGSDIKISGTLKNPNGNALTNVNIKISINGITTSVKTDKNGTYTLAAVADTAGTNNITATYTGNSKYNAASAKTTYTVTQDTSKLNPILTVDSIENVQYGDTITIHGTFKNPSGKALTSANLKISVNGIKTAVKTDKNGTYSLTITANTTGDNNIVVIYTGNSKYNPTRASTSFTLKQDTQITINPITNAKTNEAVTISGTFKNDQGKTITSANLKVTLNGVTTTVKTDSKGVYTLTTTNTIQGTNNITVTYPGNTKYNKSTIQTTFTCT